MFILKRKASGLFCWHYFSPNGGEKIIYMKWITALASLLLLVGSTAFKPISGLDDVIAALKGGNATELAKYVDDNIEIALPEKTDTYSRAQALIILQNFFAANAVRNFELKHKGDNSGGQFCIGTLYTKAGNYRTTVFMSAKGGKQLVRVIQFQSL